MITDLHSEIVYPSSDGKRTADNTLQFCWIVTIEGGLESVFQTIRTYSSPVICYGIQSKGCLAFASPQMSWWRSAGLRAIASPTSNGKRITLHASRI